MASTSGPAPSSSSTATLAAFATTVAKVPGGGDAPDEAAAKPHYVLKRGVVKGFRNPYPSYANAVGLASMVRQIVWPLVTGRLRRPDTRPPTVPVVRPAWLPSRSASHRLRATWLGHACYYVEFPSGLRVLFDPVFDDRCSPLPFAGPRRFTPRPCDVGDMPLVDAVVISHSHYDHLSHGTVLALQRRHPRVHFFVGLGLEQWFRRCGIANVTELDWWEDAELTVEAAAGGDKPGARLTMTARISCLPSQHTSARTPLDRDSTLWCSWAVRAGGRSVWFAGDTGYRAVPRLPPGADDYGPDYDALPRCPQFRQIGALRGPFDLGLIPIGAYHPRPVFSAMHANPFDAVEIFRDTRCRAAMAMHWGTWALTFEDVLEPPRLLREALRRRGIPETGVFDVCDIGASREF